MTRKQEVARNYYLRYRDKIRKRVNVYRALNKDRVNARVKAYYWKNRETVLERLRAQVKAPHRKATSRLALEKHNARHPDRMKARRLVAHAVERKGLKRQPCEVCNNPKTHAHHDDYSKPFEIRWLCLKHHAERHGKVLSYACASSQNVSGSVLPVSGLSASV